jgi:hypothetical protein
MQAAFENFGDAVITQSLEQLARRSSNCVGATAASFWKIFW